MDILSVLFLSVVIVLGGVIALVADRLGRTLGKKRLTYLRMRPRRTAEVITVVAGMLITTLTIVVLLVGSSDLRRLLFEGQKAIQEAEQKKQEVKSLTGERDALESEVKGIRKQLDDATVRVADLRKKAAQFEAIAKEAGLKVAKLNHQISNLATSIRRTANQLAGTRSELLLAQAKRDQLKGNYDELKRQTDELKDQINDLLKTNEQLQKDALTLKTTLEGLQIEIGRLGSENTAKQNELSAKQRELDETSQKLNDGRQLLADLQRELSLAESKLENLLAGPTATSRYQPLMFARGEEASRLQIEPNLADAQARLELARLIRSARVEAEARGAQPGQGVPSAGIFPRDDRGALISIEDQEREIVRGISRMEEPLVMVARSALNAFKGEPVALEIRWYRNPVVFHAGEVIAEGRIEGNLSIGEILSQISDLLTTKVKERARSVGMVPVAGKESSFGSVNPAAVMEIVNQVKETGRPVRLQILAHAETRAGDPLALDFRIR